MSSGKSRRSMRSCRVSARVEKLADGFQFTEGPVWSPRRRAAVQRSQHQRDLPLVAARGVSVFRSHSGYTGADVGACTSPARTAWPSTARAGSPSREHGNRRITRTEPTARSPCSRTASRASGSTARTTSSIARTARCTSPIRRSACPGVRRPGAELDFFGVFCLRDGKLTVVTRICADPTAWPSLPTSAGSTSATGTSTHKFVMRYEVQPDGSLRDGKVFFDMTRARRAPRRSTGSRSTRAATCTSPARGRVGDLAGGKHSGHDARAGAAGELRLGRRRPEGAVLHRAHGLYRGAHERRRVRAALAWLRV